MRNAKFKTDQRLPTAVEAAGAKPRYIPWGSLRITGPRYWPLSPFSGRDMEEATKAQ